MPTTFAVLGSGGLGHGRWPCTWPATRATASASGAPARRAGSGFASGRENAALLPGVHIPDSVHLTTDAAEAAAGADGWVVAVPTAFLRATLSRLKPVRRPTCRSSA